MTRVGVVTVHLDRTEKRRALPPGSPVTIGRGQSNGLRIEEPWVSSVLAEFRPVADGWMVHFGQRSKVTVSGLWVDGQAVYQPNAQTFLGDGVWRLEWRELAHPCRINVDVHPKRPGEQLPPYLIASEPVRTQVATALPGVDLQPEQRHQLAVVFRHLILEGPAPHNLYGAAAERLGVPVNSIRNLLNRTRERINRHRGQPLGTSEELGSYLVFVTGDIDEGDLDPRG